VDLATCPQVGVEHLLRDINDPSVSNLAAEIRHKLLGLRGLTDRLRQMHTYLMNVSEGRLPPNHEILANMQTIVSMLPNLSVESLVRAMFVQTNDMHLVCVSGAVRLCWAPVTRIFVRSPGAVHFIDCPSCDRAA
jgi:26S proteasome regulatory subunit N8